MTTHSAELGGRVETAAQSVFIHFDCFTGSVYSAHSAALGQLNAAEREPQVTARFSINSAALGHFSHVPRRVHSATRLSAYKGRDEWTVHGHVPTSAFERGGITPMESVSTTTNWPRLRPK